MPKRRRGNNLERWEVALVKAMLGRGGYNDQGILAYFTRPTRSINHRVISEIRSGTKHHGLRMATADELDQFLITWPGVDPCTGLSLRGDELLIKAREAMIAAVHTFNGAGLYFRAELFIVTAIIAWTYLLHAYFRREGVEYRYFRAVNGVSEIDRTENGAEKYWELGRCLRCDDCKLENGVKKNLEFLLGIRHEIEHRSTNRIDDAISATLQACCINFNNAIKTLFGAQYALERRLPIALQFVTFDSDQRAALKLSSELPAHIATMIEGFRNNLTDDELGDPSFAYRVFFVSKLANRANVADQMIEFVKPGADEEVEINRILIRNGEPKKYKPKQIVDVMQATGYPRFTIARHTDAWKELDAKNLKKGFGVYMGDGQWYWYESWMNRVKAHCEENMEKYA